MESWVIIGRGIRIIRQKDTIVYTEINYSLKNSESDTLDTIINFDEAKDIDVKERTIRLPVKRN